ncbi:MAG TPA: hypothetical protein VGK34_10025 [Armatimonadota bacterium]|jgi:hypothetical protein
MNRWKSGFGSFGVLVLLISLSIVVTIPAWGDQKPNPNGPLVLLGFEGAEGIKGWTGVNCETLPAGPIDDKSAWSGIRAFSTSSHVSEGKSAMSFTFPEYKKSGVAYPGVVLDWNEGRGYAIKDWSQYGKVAFDVWVDGDKECLVSLELRNRFGQNGSGSYAIIKPGKPNLFELSLGELAAFDASNVQEIMIYTSRPTSDFTVTVDNFRLLPADKQPFAEFDLVYPNYRDMVFPNAKAIRASVSANADDYGLKFEQLEMRMTAIAGKSVVSRRSGFKSSTVSIEIPTAGLKAGAIKVFASVADKASGKVLASKTWDVRKITQTEVASLKVYVDENNNTIVDGKPFFTMGWYDSGPLDHMAEICDSSFNCILNYGSNMRPKANILRYLDLLNAKGKKFIYCMNDVYPSSTYMDGKTWEGVSGNAKIVDAVVKAYKNHPALLAWYLNDERPRSLVPELRGYYKTIREADPGHPCYIVLCNMADLKYFADTTDVTGVDPYPVPSSPLGVVGDDTALANASVGNHKPVWVVPQGFAWYQFNSTNPDRGHVPTDEELRTGRAPNYEESRCMAYLAIANGAKGLVYFSYYNLRVLPNYEELWTGLKKIAKEVEVLSPVLLSPEDLGKVSCSPAGVTIHTKLKRLDGQLYLIAVNAENVPCKVTFDLKHQLPKQADVMFEGRFAREIDGTKLTDSFKPYEVHIYDFGKTTNN